MTKTAVFMVTFIAWCDIIMLLQEKKKGYNFMKRIISLLLVAVMLFAIIPFSAFSVNASEYSFTIFGVNVPVEEGKVVVCTSLEQWAFCNPNWSMNLQLTPYGNGYKVVAQSVCPVEKVEYVTAEELIKASGFTSQSEDIYVILHGGDGNNNAYNLQEGMYVAISEIAAGGKITFSNDAIDQAQPTPDEVEPETSEPSPDESEPETSDDIDFTLGEIIDFDATFDITVDHTNITLILTEGYDISGYQWCFHAAYAPTGVENVYEVIEIADPSGTSNGVESALSVPDGGFVTITYLWGGDACGKAIAEKLEEGMKVKIAGLDLNNKIIDEDATITFPSSHTKINVENNIALGKPYTTAEPYRMGDASVDWCYDATAPVTYPDEGGITLTDGIIAYRGDYYNEAWYGLHGNTPDAAEKGYTWATVDLEEMCYVSQVQLYVPTDLGAGVVTPNSVSFWASDDGVDYYEIGQVTSKQMTAVNDVTAVASINCEINARYIEARSAYGGWVFVSEMAVVGSVDYYPETGEPETSEPVDVTEDPSEEASESPEEPEETYIDDQGVEYTLSDDGTYYTVTDCDTSVTSITIPAEINGVPVKEIGDSAFEYCESLISIEIPNSVTTIGDHAFKGCKSLTSISIPNSVTTIGDWAFYACTSLTSISIPNSVTTIGDGVFISCTSLTSIEIPNSVTIIGDSAFLDCSSLTNIEIPDSVTTIGVSPFRGCSSLEEIIVDNGNENYYSENNCLIEKSTNTLISGCKNSVIPNSVTTIGDYAFYWCESLTSIEIPNSVTTIGDHAFSVCSSLEDVVFGDSLITIGEEAFRYCEKLCNIVLPESLKTISMGAFAGCDNITEVIIPASVTSFNLWSNGFGREIGLNVFAGCNIESFVVSDGNPVYHSVGNCIIETKTKTLIAGCKNSIIPNDGSVISIGSAAFAETAVNDITIPNSVTSLNEAAFYRCTSMTSIEIPDSVTTIGDYAFEYCESLTDIYCEAETQPEGWSNYWLYGCDATVHWGYESSDEDTSNEDTSKPEDTSSEPEVSDSEVSSEPEVSESEEVIYDIQEDTKIEIEANDAFEPGTIVSVVESVIDDVKETIKDAINTTVTIGGYNGTISDLLFGGNVKNQIFDFSAEKDGKETQPQKPIVINIPIPQGYSDNVSIKYLNPNGTLEDVEYTVDKNNRTVKATIEHFSYYVLIDEGDLEYNLGDINDNGKIDMTDYILLKRAYFGTYNFTETQKKVGDINGNQKIDMTDYILVKRMYFGTYKIK